MIIWALFDSGNGCYTQAVEKYFSNIEIYPVGVDVENKNDHFINLNLADNSDLFGESEMFKMLDKLPKPDIILASPPCESWSTTQSIKNGSFMWKMAHNIDCLFQSHVIPAPFTVQTKKDYIRAKVEINKRQGFNHTNQFERDFKRRINGELCAFNTIEIIKKYTPKIWVIENPAYGKIWDYFKIVHDFSGIKNIAHYNDYDENFPLKPTIFLSNRFLDLKASGKQAVAKIHNKSKAKTLINSYNERSNIPLPLIKHIVEICRKEFENANAHNCYNS